MTDNMLGPSLMHISSIRHRYTTDFAYFPGPIESVISKLPVISTTLLQIFCEFCLHSEVIFKSMVLSRRHFPNRSLGMNGLNTWRVG